MSYGRKATISTDQAVLKTGSRQGARFATGSGEKKKGFLSQRRRDRRVTKKIKMLRERTGNGCFERV
jgi:hypothetical protein